ncbi:hypothetical protein U27_02923 [Candidatus Vecturithrix granuli]|uniref:Uncharacterized protein n=1 Tax=Vecturithrix granuli TaxID=1499967 RepID=A0A081BUF7_VECG1|nr:hypothetical protein U27_02923 [Candidatus Vecturithrix granuli]
MNTRDTFPNPFFAKTPVSSGTFFGRAQLLNKLFCSVNGGKFFIILIYTVLYFSMSVAKEYLYALIQLLSHLGV